MTDDTHLERLLVAAGERQRAAAPDAAAAQRALQQLGRRRTAEPAESSGRRRRIWPIAAVVAGAAAVALAVTVAGNSGTDSIRTVPATQPEATTPLPETTAAVPGDSTAGDLPVELDFPIAVTDLVLGPPISREFDGLPLTDVAVSPDADSVAVNLNDEVCVISTSPEVPTGEDRCYSFPGGIATGSITWAPDGATLVFHHDLFQRGQEPDLVQLDISSGELTVLTDDGVPVDGDDGDGDVAPTFASDGTLYFFRIDTTDGVRAVLHRYVGDGVVTGTGPALEGVPGRAGRSAVGDSIMVMLSRLDGESELVSVDVVGGTSRSIPVGLSQAVVDVARDRAIVVAPSGVGFGGSELGIADFTSGTFAPIDIPLLGESSMRVVGGGLSPDGDSIALIIADQDDPDGHLLLVADIVADGSVGPLAVLASGPEFAPNDGDQTIKPAGLGNLGEIVWTDTAFIYSLGPNKVITLPLL